jgi:hypothetical protein
MLQVVKRAQERLQPQLGALRQQPACDQAVFSVIHVVPGTQLEHTRRHFGDALADQGVRLRGCLGGRQVHDSAVDVAVQQITGFRQRVQGDVVTAPRERFGQIRRVHDAAARLGRIGKNPD